MEILRVLENKCYHTLISICLRICFLVGFIRNSSLLEICLFLCWGLNQMEVKRCKGTWPKILNLDDARREAPSRQVLDRQKHGNVTLDLSE